MQWTNADGAINHSMRDERKLAAGYGLHSSHVASDQHLDQSSLCLLSAANVASHSPRASFVVAYHLCTLGMSGTPCCTGLVACLDSLRTRTIAHPLTVLSWSLVNRHKGVQILCANLLLIYASVSVWQDRQSGTVAFPLSVGCDSLAI